MSVFGRMMDEAEETVAQLRAENEQLRKALEAVQFGSRIGFGVCSHCFCHQSEGHKPDCLVGIALGRPECAK